MMFFTRLSTISLRETIGLFMVGVCFCATSLPVSAGQMGKSTTSASTGSIPSSRQITLDSAHPVFVDPVTGKTIWTANVRTAEAKTSADGSLMSEMDGVDGILYEQGKPADAFSAPKVIYDDANKTVTASGGVKIRSLEQKSSSLTCDSVIWYPSKSKLIGTGNVVFRSGNFMQTGPTFHADTRMRDVVMRSSAKQSVHMSFQP